MRVAIFGSRGFVGSHIAQAAQRRGWRVHHIGSETENVAALVRDSDAVVHSVGSFMPDRRYKKLVSSPISLGGLAQLASMRLGLNPPNPLEPTLSELNFDSAKFAAETVMKTHFPDNKKASGLDQFPFVFLSASEWELADFDYIASKRKAEAYLNSIEQLRSIVLRPAFIAPEKAKHCSETTPRHLIDSTLQFAKPTIRTPVTAIAEAACDAIDDFTVEGVIGPEVLRTFMEI